MCLSLLAGDGQKREGGQEGKRRQVNDDVVASVGKIA
jgi:hypothetical protein